MTTTTHQNTAVSIDEYIEMHRPDITVAELLDMRRFLPAMGRKSLQAQEVGFDDLVKGIEILTAIITSEHLKTLDDPLPRHLAEAGVAARYLIKGIDLIPDTLPGIGLADDAWIVARVIQRNPALLEFALLQSKG